jgi:hypothetical protein
MEVAARMRRGLNMEAPMEKNQESRIRRLARRNGYVVRKSRARKYVPTMNNLGEFMLIEASRNFVVLGERFNATPEDIETFFTARKAA